jgi:hypothetical protein
LLEKQVRTSILKTLKLDNNDTQIFPLLYTNFKKPYIVGEFLQQNPKAFATKTTLNFPRYCKSNLRSVLLSSATDLIPSSSFFVFSDNTCSLIHDIWFTNFICYDTFVATQAPSITSSFLKM